MVKLPRLLKSRPYRLLHLRPLSNRSPLAEQPLVLEVEVLPEAAQEAIEDASGSFAQFKKCSNVLG